MWGREVTVWERVYSEGVWGRDYCAGAYPGFQRGGGGGCKGGGISFAMGGAAAAAPAPIAGADRQGGGGPPRNTSLAFRQIHARRGFPHLDIKINFGRGGGGGFPGNAETSMDTCLLCCVG